MSIINCLVLFFLFMSFSASESTPIGAFDGFVVGALPRFGQSATIPIRFKSNINAKYGISCSISNQSTIALAGGSKNMLMSTASLAAGTYYVSSFVISFTDTGYYPTSFVFRANCASPGYLGEVITCSFSLSSVSETKSFYISPYGTTVGTPSWCKISNNHALLCSNGFFVRQNFSSLSDPPTRRLALESLSLTYFNSVIPNLSVSSCELRLLTQIDEFRIGKLRGSVEPYRAFPLVVNLNGGNAHFSFLDTYAIDRRNFRMTDSPARNVLDFLSASLYFPCGGKTLPRVYNFELCLLNVGGISESYIYRFQVTITRDLVGNCLLGDYCVGVV